MKICFTTAIYTHTGGLIRLYIVIWSVLSQFKWLLLFLHHAWRGHGARLSIRTKDPNNHSDTETGTLSSTGTFFMCGHHCVQHGENVGALLPNLLHCLGVTAVRALV